MSERFWRGNGKAYENSDVLHALCRTGTRFCQSLLRPLQNTDCRVAAVTLEGVQAIARSLDPSWLADASPDAYAAHPVLAYFFVLVLVIVLVIALVIVLVLVIGH